MANEKTLYRICPHCGGDHLIDINTDNPNAGDPIEFIEVECPYCPPSGMIPFGELNDDFITLLMDMKADIADIKEKVDEL